MRLDAEGKTLGLLREHCSRASLRRAASASKTTHEKLPVFFTLPVFFMSFEGRARLMESGSLVTGEGSWGGAAEKPAVPGY